MSRRYPSGFIRPGYNPLEVPDAPTGVSASGGDSSASVSFTAPADIGGAAITAYYAVSNPDQITGTASASPVTVSGLTNGTSYTFTVWALNSYGPRPYSASSNSVSPVATYGIFAGGNANTNIIQYVSISTLGNTADWGDLLIAGNGQSGCASTTRGVFAGAETNSGNSNVIQYITFASAGNASDFGDLASEDKYMAGVSSSTRGVFSGGSNNGALNIINYITIASAGNASEFGELGTFQYGAAPMCSPTRGVFASGQTTGGDRISTMQYITIASTGNSTTFGSLSSGATAWVAGCSSDTRGLVMGGDQASIVNTIQYITIASTGNTTDFGDLLEPMYQSASMVCSNTRGLCGGGGNVAENSIYYITIASTGNAVDFGDLTAPRTNMGGCSNGHGGLQ